MSGRSQLAGEADDAMVAEALKHFKSSMDAWSEAAYRRPRTAWMGSRMKWRLAASWALGCSLVAATLAGTLYERHARQESARIAAIKAAEQRAALERKAPEQPVADATVSKQRPVAVKRVANQDDSLLATVDSDVSRQVPAAMEPLAQMMETTGAN